MKIVDKIDIDKENESVEQIRKLNSQSDDTIPKKKTERGFCTKCLIF